MSSMKSKVEYLDQPPDGNWFVLDVMKRNDLRKWDWCAILVDVDPDEWAGDRAVPPRRLPTANVYLRIPGKHRNWDAARETLEAMLATRH